MNDYLKVKITIYSEENFIKYATTNNINMYQIKKDKNNIICIIKKDDIDKIRKFYHTEILKYYTKKNYLLFIKKNFINVINIIYAIVLFLFLSHIIVNININLENKELLNKLTKELELNNIKRLTLKKTYNEIEDIKKKIMNNLQDEIEWLEIENEGMIYNIKVEPRKKDKIEQNSERCNVIANKSGVITKIISDSGEVLTENNAFVKNGDVLISGSIKLNEEVKSDICASGKVYAERWYSVNLDIPNTIEEKKYTNKKDIIYY